MQEEQTTEGTKGPETKVVFQNQERRFAFCGHDLKIIQHLKNLDIPAVIWPTGLALCRYFEKVGLNFSGKKVIELGSGTGFVGILAVLLGGDVTLTDLPMVLNQVEENVAKNIPSNMMQRSKVSALQWGEDHGNFTSDYDVILGSGVVYYRRHFRFLIDTLLHLSNERTVIYLSSSMCHDTGAVDFHENIVPQHFNSEIVDRIESKDISVFKITRKHTTFQ
ncbi:EEF1A lysine methyltransferase 3-like [Mobula birostris]|uniref:EEF1A lysine methyltransferase 3-like n=1 Tax=Mobula birostris TaxID=1983395 RepID=UPI003B2817B3